jgi:flagellar biosynthetic protein FliR
MIMPGSGNITAWVVVNIPAVVVVFARVVGFAWTAPGWGIAGIGWRIRLGLAVLLTAVFAPILAAKVTLPLESAAIAKACVIEAAVGAALGLCAALVVAGARQAGDIVGAQAGLSPASFLDPDASDGLTALGHLYGIIALAIFLALDGPMQLIGALLDSYHAVPVGGLVLNETGVSVAFGRIGWALTLALRAAAPAGLALILAGIALGLLARGAPSLQIMGTSLAIRSVVGLVLVLLGLVAVVATFSSAWTETFSFWDG